MSYDKAIYFWKIHNLLIIKLKKSPSREGEAKKQTIANGYSSYDRVPTTSIKEYPAPADL